MSTILAVGWEGQEHQEFKTTLSYKDSMIYIKTLSQKIEFRWFLQAAWGSLGPLTFLSPDEIPILLFLSLSLGCCSETAQNYSDALKPLPTCCLWCCCHVADLHAGLAQRTWIFLERKGGCLFRFLFLFSVLWFFSGQLLRFIACLFCGFSFKR